MFDFKEVFILARWLALYAGACCAWPALAATSRDDAEIQRWIQQHAQRANSIEVPGARYRVVGDLDGDGVGDVALLYTLKSRAASAGESRYLAAFKRHADKAGGRRDTGLRYHAHVLVSGPGAGEANRVTILKGTMVVEMLTFGAGDAACCPTRAATRRYRLGARGLTLVVPEAPRRKP